MQKVNVCFNQKHKELSLHTEALTRAKLGGEGESRFLLPTPICLKIKNKKLKKKIKKHLKYE
jgi:hypothetical protein